MYLQGRKRKRAGARRGAPSPPRRKRKAARARKPAYAGRGLEAFLDPADEQRVNFPVFPSILGPPETAEIDEPLPDRAFRGLTRREGYLLSALFHLTIVLLLVVPPDFLRALEEKYAPPPPQPEKHKPLVLFVEPQAPAPTPVPAPPPAQAPAPEPPRTADNRLLIPKATRPSPEPQEFQNDLPFSRGNTDEFYTDQEVKKPGDEGEPGEEKKAGEESGKPDSEAEREGERSGAASEEGKKLASLLPPDFSFPGMNGPGKTPAPGPGQAATPSGGEGGSRGEGGQFEEIQRFLQGMRFQNPEGGLVTGRDNTLYYNDKGANFVPWLRRMLSEVKRYWFASMPQSAMFQAGHVAVAVTVQRDGKIADLKVLVPAGISGFDNAAVGALRAADFLPLPSDYPDDRFEFVLVFWYNERPYDLF